MNTPSSDCAGAHHGAQHFSRSLDRYLDDVVFKLTREFADRIEPEVVNELVRDSFERLLSHVPRTADVYLVPWVRQRLLGRLTERREPSLTEMLSVPPQRL